MLVGSVNVYSSISKLVKPLTLLLLAYLRL